MRNWRIALALTVLALLLIGYLGRPPVDWKVVATSVVTAVIVAWLTFLLAFFGIPRIVTRAREESRLLEVAQLRTRGVALRNEGERPREAAPVADWVARAKQWELDAIEAVRRSSPVEGERLSTLDRTGPSTVRGLAPEHDGMLRILNGTLARMDDFLARHSPAMF